MHFRHLPCGQLVELLSLLVKCGFRLWTFRCFVCRIRDVHKIVMTQRNAHPSQQRDIHDLFCSVSFDARSRGFVSLNDECVSCFPVGLKALRVSPYGESQAISIGPSPSWMLALRCFAICTALRIPLGLSTSLAHSSWCPVGHDRFSPLDVHCRALPVQEANAASALVELNRTFLTDLLAKNNRAWMFA